FEVTAPAKGDKWVNGQTYPVSWEKGLFDGVDTFDIELSRMSKSGLILVAKDVQSIIGTVNLAIQSVPEADDYFLFFLNSTHGVMYGNSLPFSITSSSSGSSSPNIDATKPTVTISGGPNPTAAWATTFPPSANGVRALKLEGVTTGLVATVTVGLGLIGGAWVVL
ncbi:hypothetical protein HETIRDRAFT_330027, partial [Heterobasidion irregulare TC 32-1]